MNKSLVFYFIFSPFAEYYVKQRPLIIEEIPVL